MSDGCSGVASRLYQRGITLIEVMVSIVVVALMAAGVIQALLMSERSAATARLSTNARAVTQRNIDAVMEVGYTVSGTTSLTPVVLQSPPSGFSTSICDDDGASPTENISVLLSGSSAMTAAATIATGTLTRIIAPLPSSSFPSDVVSSGTGPVVMSVTFRIDYDYRSKHYTYSQTTLRSRDIQP